MTEVELTPNDDTERLDMSALSATTPPSPLASPAPSIWNKYRASSTYAICLSSVTGFNFCEDFRNSPRFTILEWLGDAFLNFCNGYYLARLEPNLDPKVFGQGLLEIRSASTHTKCTQNCFIGTDDRSLHDLVAEYPSTRSRSVGRKSCSDWLEAYFGLAIELSGFEDDSVWESAKEITMMGLSVMKEPTAITGRGKKRPPVECQVARDFTALIFSFLSTETLRSFVNKQRCHCVYHDRICISLINSLRQDLCKSYPDLQQSEPATDPKSQTEQFLAEVAKRLTPECDLSAVSNSLFRDLRRHPSVKQKLENFEARLREICDIRRRGCSISSKGTKRRAANISNHKNSNEKLPALLEEVAPVRSNPRKRPHDRTMSNDSTASVPYEQDIEKKSMMERGKKRK